MMDESDHCRGAAQRFVCSVSIEFEVVGATDSHGCPFCADLQAVPFVAKPMLQNTEDGCHPAPSYFHKWVGSINVNMVAMYCNPYSRRPPKRNHFVASITEQLSKTTPYSTPGVQDVLSGSLAGPCFQDRMPVKACLIHPISQA